MSRHLWILRTLLSHWRRRPVQLATLILGLAIATALWSGVQALNAQARQSYDRAASIIGGDGRASVVAEGSGPIDQSDYVALRLAGIPVSPVLEGEIRIEGARFRLIGIDPVTLPADAGPLSVEAEEGDEGPDDRLVEFLIQPSLALADAGTVTRLGMAEPVLTETGEALPPLAVSDALAPETIVTDIGVAQRLLDRPGSLSRLIVTSETPLEAGAMEAAGVFGLQVQAPDEDGDLERLTDSFHLNLTAFGLLSFLVGLFIVHSAIGLAFEQRRPMLRTLRACGVSARALSATLIGELVVLAMIAGLAGVVLGYLIAATLLPDVAASLRGLYGAEVSGQLSLSPAWWVAGVAISVAGALLAAGASLWKAHRLPLFAPAQPHAWAEAQGRSLTLQLWAGLVIAVLCIPLGLFGTGLVAGFALMGGILLAAALLLPVALAGLLRIGERFSAGPLTQWFFADSRQQLTGLSMALMALLLALAVNVGVGTMVDSFRLTFTGWLDQRLAAELYVGGDTAEEGADIAAYLEARPEVEAVLPVWSAEGRFEDWPIEIYGFRDHPTYSGNWPLLSSEPDVWPAVAAGEAILVSEQMARRFALSAGDEIELATERGPWAVEVGGIYSDYGNPRGQVMVAVGELVERFEVTERNRFAVRTAPERVPALMDDLRGEFDLSPTQLVDQAALKALSQSVFDRTFAVTLALNALTLFVAGVAMLTSLLTLATLRLPQLGPLWAVGVTRRRLASIELTKAVALAVLTALLALPLGLLVAWVLMSVINVQAFGWKLPLHLFPLQWLKLLALAILTAVIAAAWPSLTLRRTPPSTLLKVFADER
jgi:putative ABC transport system permease protein